MAFIVKRWSAWNHVIVGYSEDEAWELRSEFLDARAYYCLLQPAPDEMPLLMVTNSIHQVRLALNQGYQDHLLGDLTADGKRRFPTREAKEKQLADIVSVFSGGMQFMELLNASTIKPTKSNKRPTSEILITTQSDHGLYGV